MYNTCQGLYCWSREADTDGFVVVLSSHHHQAATSASPAFVGGRGEEEGQTKTRRNDLGDFWEDDQGAKEKPLPKNLVARYESHQKCRWKEGETKVFQIL